MFFESFLINLSVLAMLVIALTFDYVTKFFNYWYVRHIPYKSSIPFFGSDYHRVLGVTTSTNETKKLYSKYPKSKFVGRVKSRIPDLIVKDPDSVKRMLSTDFANFHSRGLGLNKSQDVCLKNNVFYADGEKWNVLRATLESLLNGLVFDVDIRNKLPGTNGDTSVRELLSNILDDIFKDMLLANENIEAFKEIRINLEKRTMVDKLKSYTKNIFPSVYTLLKLKTLSGRPSQSLEEQIKKSKIIKHIKMSGTMYNIGNKREPVSEIEFTFSTITSFITEGYIPIVTVLTALLFELASNKDCQDKARSIVAKVNREDYLDLSIKEALRLHPPYSIITRQCVKSYQYPESKLTIDKRVTINVPIEAIHRDEEHYKEANVFNPDRFLDDDRVSKHCYAYLPFGAGPRRCIGESLALQIIRSISKAILSNYELEKCDRTPSKLDLVDHNFGRIIDKDIWLRFKRIN
ncbi:hypothetical protein K1T71_008943 [Dendrolimus kikuchii]|uniref:Uncharacterized protein n=1 Tax=Dendrolimus kikuchii TaxID=765133 RepID=A0ACC1CVP8_9NEOP|nr:hypothetical protein K1T71_008943 [Dendrolimus kikuchii]